MDGPEPSTLATPAAAAQRNRIGSAAAGRPIERHREAVLGEQAHDVGHGHDLDVVPGVDPGGGELREDPVLPVPRRDGDEHAAARRDGECGHGVVGDPPVTFPRIRVRGAQAGDRAATEAHRGVEHAADLDARVAEGRVGADDARPHGDDRDVGVDLVAGDGERGVDGHRLVIAAEGLAGGDRGREQVTLAHARDEIAQRDRERGAVGHHVGDAGIGPGGADREHDGRDLAVQGRGDHRHAVDARACARDLVEVLLGGADVGLEARVPELHDVPGPPLGPFVAREVPVDEVPATGPETEVDRGRVDDHAVADGDGPDEPGEHAGRLGGLAAEVDLDALQAVTGIEDPDDLPRPERRHPANLPGGPVPRATR